MYYRMCMIASATGLAQAAGNSASTGADEWRGRLLYAYAQGDRKNLPQGQRYQPLNEHGTAAVGVDYLSRPLGGVWRLALGGIGTVQLARQDKHYLDELAFSNSRTRWKENWRGDHSGVSLYRAAIEFAQRNRWGRAGYLQPAGQTLIVANWGAVPGTYRGVEVGMKQIVAADTSLALSYFWSDRYKAPWYQRFYDFRQTDGRTPIAYIHSLGAAYRYRQLGLELAYGQAEGYMEQYMAKFAWDQDELSLSYQFYAARDRIQRNGLYQESDVYDGVAWRQAVTSVFNRYPLEYRLDISWVHAPGNQGFFSSAPTSTYASSAGRMDIGWDSRADFNADGETAVFAGIRYDFADMALPGWRGGVSYALGWGAKPSLDPQYRQTLRVGESALRFSLDYQLPASVFPDGSIATARYIIYHNNSPYADYGGGYRNLFQDERYVKLNLSIPF
ncbi:Chitoporin precursor [Dickeya solani]|uniref:N-acetylglucosamine-regulated outer membrane porin n=1 Tax=Dickeya solani D s0432-1 TaxID=1231725 RepID=A0AAV3K7C6_9GAMM|nr:Chitoporin precursor [Dickeya solani]ERO56306.1 N-acetylglucosamine-regulated outer membrane porin [Dickeya solani D s0432-1]AYQ52866.1 Chitoporin precursor [Dickeya solani]MBD3603461.1 outer membrane porin, OprD family [Dickeya solani]MZG50607.1 OprD family porin [Dickeya solani]